MLAHFSLLYVLEEPSQHALGHFVYSADLPAQNKSHFRLFLPVLEKANDAGWWNAPLVTPVCVLTFKK